MALPLLLLITAAATLAQPSNLLPPYATVALSTDGGASYKPFSLAQVASFGGPLSQLSQGLGVRLADDGPFPFACGPLGPVPPNTAILASRGNCSFSAKAAAAQAAGAAALLLYDGMAGKYLASYLKAAPLAAGACDLDCAAFSTAVPAAQVSLPEALAGFPAQCGGACASGLCALAPSPASDATGTPRRLCCVPNDYLLVGGAAAAPSGAPLSIPIAWLTAGDGAALQRAAAPATPGSAALRVLPALRPLPRWDVSGLALWALGTAVAALSSYAAAAGERSSAAGGSAVAGEAEAAAHSGVWGGRMPVETLDLTPRGAAILLACASAFLAALYLLSVYGVPIVFIVIAIFSLGSVGAVSSVALLPLLGACAARAKAGGGGCGAGAQALLAARIPTPLLCVRLWEAPSHFPALPALAYTCSCALVLTWVLQRHAGGAWVAQNAFGVCLCITAVASLRLTSLRSAALLLCALFFYDIFMVFGTPLFLGGASVMVEVATAGEPAPIPNAGLSTPACYCRLHPEDTRVCGPGETMPILFVFPRLADWRGGFSMLGLGDIVVPALALAVALRFDLTQGRTGVAVAVAVTSSSSSSSSSSRRSASGNGEVPGVEEGVGLLTSAAAAGAEAGEGGEESEGAARSPRRRAVSPSASATPASLAAATGPAALTAAPTLPRAAHTCAQPSLWMIGVMGYALGLALAQVAVVVMQLGQPALLYLVPCVLLPICAAAARRGVLEELWKGPSSDSSSSSGGDSGGSGSLQAEADGRGAFGSLNDP